MYKKVSLLSAIISVHRLDIICLSETYLNSETSPDATILVRDVKEMILQTVLKA